MRYSCFTIALLFLSLTTSAQKVTIVESPAAVPAKDNRPKIFLGGSIDMGTAENWQAKIEQQLTDKNAVLLNPPRDDWNKDWKPVISDSNFRKQVEWELSALEQADIIMYFSPTSQSPISLLELGLYAKTKKLMVVCPDGYWRKGNVDIVCKRYNIKTYDTMSALIDVLKAKLN